MSGQHLEQEDKATASWYPYKGVITFFSAPAPPLPRLPPLPPRPPGVFAFGGFLAFGALFDPLAILSPLASAGVAFASPAVAILLSYGNKDVRTSNTTASFVRWSLLMFKERRMFAGLSRRRMSDGQHQRVSDRMMNYELRVYPS